MTNNTWKKMFALVGIAAAVVAPTLGNAQARGATKLVKVKVEIEFVGHTASSSPSAVAVAFHSDHPLGIIRVKPQADGKARFAILMPVGTALTAKVPGFTSDAELEADYDGIFHFSMLPGDIDGDNLVGDSDYKLLQEAWNSQPGASNWNQVADLNGDGIVDIGDYALLSENYGRHGTVTLRRRPVPYSRLGDINEDGLIGQSDFDLLSKAFNSQQGDANYLAAADLDGDGTVDIGDYAILSQAWGFALPN
jgi:hypothetical protein